MIPAPIEHRFTLEGESYLLREYQRAGQRRIRAEYAQALAVAPQVLDAIDGLSLWAEAIARECLVEAPDLWWTDVPAHAQQNGQPKRVITTDRIPQQLWNAFVKEVNSFEELMFPPDPAVVPAAVADSPRESHDVAPPQTVPAPLRGRAE